MENSLHCRIKNIYLIKGELININIINCIQHFVSKLKAPNIWMHLQSLKSIKHPFKQKLNNINLTY